MPELPLRINIQASIITISTLRMDPWAAPVMKLEILNSSEEIAWLQEKYSFRSGTPAIAHFLAENWFLMPLLDQIRLKIEEHFCIRELSLELVSYPESLDDEQLVVLVHAAMDDDEADEALRAFEDGWWLAHLRYAQGKICVVLGF